MLGRRVDEGITLGVLTGCTDVVASLLEAVSCSSSGPDELEVKLEDGRVGVRVRTGVVSSGASDGVLLADEGRRLSGVRVLLALPPMLDPGVAVLVTLPNPLADELLSALNALDDVGLGSRVDVGVMSGEGLGLKSGLGVLVPPTDVCDDSPWLVLPSIAEALPFVPLELGRGEGEPVPEG